MSDDSELQQAVLAELNWEPSIVAAHIGVAANGGVVTLTGRVESFSQKLAAEAAARRVKGVNAVAEELKVRLPSDHRRDDAAIAAAAVERLAWDVAVPPHAVKVKVGWITLSGQVGWHYQRQAAEHDTRQLLGVVGLSNQIAIVPPAEASAIDVSYVSDAIMHALHRSWFFDPRTVAVHAQGGHVRLTGTVPTARDRQIAAETAWEAPGTTSVANDIVVT
jgi:osmotically-inducible protein OsmY